MSRLIGTDCNCTVEARGIERAEHLLRPVWLCNGVQVDHASKYIENSIGCGRIRTGLISWPRL